VAALVGAPRVDVEHHPRVHPQRRAAQPVIPRHPVAEPIRHREDPLAHRHAWQHRVHQMGGTLGHPAAAAAARAEPPPLAGTRHQGLTGATLTLRASKTTLERAAHQELPELPLDELRQAGPLAGPHRRAQESLEVLGDDLMEHGVLGVARTIRGLCTCHPLGTARAAVRQCP